LKSRNLRFFLNVDQPSLGPSEPPIRHDLFDIDRKRKLLLDEVETIKRMKMEQIEEVESIKKLKLEQIEEVESIKRIKNQVQISSTFFPNKFEIFLDASFEITKFKIFCSVCKVQNYI
jgi:hypothetical protein